MTPIVGKKYIYKNENHQWANRVFVVSAASKYSIELVEVDPSGITRRCYTDPNKNHLVPYIENGQLELFE
jgi:hypothetical protein